MEMWNVWNGETFEQPDLEEPWAPYITADKMLECRPETFEVKIYKKEHFFMYENLKRTIVAQIPVFHPNCQFNQNLDSYRFFVFFFSKFQFFGF